ncbi:hypothetical protein JG687_00002641 [Phytophthora cactorum]|uniref:MSP domain-containing protein n=1 Tax=Phytophthora cactorum TaxID=29920 RepID=A0A8T1UWF4_9STRA|nr:hypothetical protein JG687_00002641 [Phytophthora cactorum]
MITASVGVGSSLLLEPARELLFPVPDATSAQRPRCNLKLTNLSPLNDVVFRVRTRNPDAFTVRPTHGLVAPGASVQVTITATARTCERLSAMDPRDLMTRQSSELFVVQSVEREEEVQAMEPLDPNSNTSLRAFWKKVSKDSVTENKMVCRFTGASGFPAAEVTQDWNMFSRTLSTDTAPSEPTHEIGPLLYHIQPSDMLSFNVEPAPRFWGSTSLYIVNSSQNDCLTFKVRTSNQSGYVVKPSRGLVSTTSAQEVVVSLCAPRDENNFDPEKRESKDGFMIEVANISRDKYTDLVKLDERKRTREISSLWSLMPRSDRESTMLSVEFKMNDSDYGSGTLESSESGNSNARSWSSSSAHKNRNKTAQRQSLHSVVQGMKELSTSSSTDESHESAVGDRLNSIYPYSDSDESAFTIAPTAVPTEVGDDDNNDDSTYSSASKTPQDSAVIVVSADRMDTVDFSNPKLSFFI